MKDCIWVIQLVSAVAVAVAAFFAWWSSKAAGKSAKAVENTVKAQIIIHITSTYSSSEMFESIKNLYAWKRGHGVDFAKVFSKRLEERGHSDAERIDEDRRRISHYFHQLTVMLDCEVIDENFVKKLVKSDQVDTLLDIVEPLEEVKNPDYDHLTFDTFRRIYCKES